MEGEVTLAEAAELLFAARGRIDFYWNFQVAVILAVIGWSVSLKRPLPRSMKALVSGAYLIAAAANLAALYSAYTFAEALRTDLLRLAADSPLTGTRALLAQHSYLAQRTTAFWIHLAVGVVVLLAIWFARPLGIADDDSAPASERGTGAKRKGRRAKV